MKAIHRLYKYIENKGIKPTRLEKEIGLSNGYLGTQLKREADLGEGVLNKIIDFCLDINPEWLLTGKGPMLRSDEHKPSAQTVVYERDPRDVELIATQKQLIKMLQQGSSGLGVGSVPTVDYPSQTSIQRHRK
jgi:hypothetical protein